MSTLADDRNALPETPEENRTSPDGRNAADRLLIHFWRRMQVSTLSVEEVIEGLEEEGLNAYADTLHGAKENLVEAFHDLARTVNDEADHGFRHVLGNGDGSRPADRRGVAPGRLRKPIHELEDAQEYLSEDAPDREVAAEYVERALQELREAMASELPGSHAHIEAGSFGDDGLFHGHARCHHCGTVEELNGVDTARRDETILGLDSTYLAECCPGCGSRFMAMDDGKLAPVAGDRMWDRVPRPRASKEVFGALGVASAAIALASDGELVKQGTYGLREIMSRLCGHLEPILEREVEARGLDLSDAHFAFGEALDGFRWEDEPSANGGGKSEDAASGESPQVFWPEWLEDGLSAHLEAVTGLRERMDDNGVLDDLRVTPGQGDSGMVAWGAEYVLQGVENRLTSVLDCPEEHADTSSDATVGVLWELGSDLALVWAGIRSVDGVGDLAESLLQEARALMQLGTRVDEESAKWRSQGRPPLRGDDAA